MPLFEPWEAGAADAVVAPTEPMMAATARAPAPVAILRRMVVRVVGLSLLGTTLVSALGVSCMRLEAVLVRKDMVFSFGSEDWRSVLRGRI